MAIIKINKMGESSDGKVSPRRGLDAKEITKLGLVWKRLLVFYGCPGQEPFQSRNAGNRAQLPWLQRGTQKARNEQG